MSSTYFYENTDPHQRWQFTQIYVGRDFVPYYQLLTGGCNQRFMLSSCDNTLYWGQVSEGHYNVDFLCQNQPWQRQQMPIRPITSVDIETFKRANPADSDRYWASFFAKELIQSPASFLHQGQWRIAAPFRHQKDEAFISLDSAQEVPSPEWYWSFLWSECDYDFEYTFNHSDHLLTTIDWDNSPQNPLPLKPPPATDDGRVKWWRKKIRENVCPPLLLWWQSNLLSHIVIDGHSRWLAHQLENSKPDVLVISAFKTFNYKDKANPKKRLYTLQGIEHYINNAVAHHQSVSMDKINGMLLDAYPDTTYHEAITVGKPVVDLDERWEHEVSKIIALTSNCADKKILETMLLRHDNATPISKF